MKFFNGKSRERCKCNLDSCSRLSLGSGYTLQTSSRNLTHSMWPSAALKCKAVRPSKSAEFKSVSRSKALKHVSLNSTLLILLYEGWNLRWASGPYLRTMTSLFLITFLLVFWPIRASTFYKRHSFKKRIELKASSEVLKATGVWSMPCMLVLLIYILKAFFYQKTQAEELKVSTNSLENWSKS